MSTMPLVEVKNHLSEVISNVQRTHERVTVTKNGRPAAVILAAEDLEALEETLAVLSNPELRHQIEQSQDDLAAGRTVAEDDLAEAMADRRRRESE
jgi:prevent-host-death family protein